MRIEVAVRVTTCVFWVVVCEASRDCGCLQEYGTHPLYKICYKACQEDATTDAEFPYWLGPVDLKAYHLTGHSKEINNISGKIYARVNAARDQIKFKYAMDQDVSTTSFWPFVGMHLHMGRLDKDEIGGNIIVHVAGKSTIKSCLWKEALAKTKMVVCSAHCLPDSQPSKGGTCYKPKNITAECNCGASIGEGKMCFTDEGSCDKDRRGTNGDASLTPSRLCDEGDDSRPSNPVQGAWLSGKHSMEYSGNKSDGDEYSPYSIYIPDNYKYFCGVKIPFLKELFTRNGAATYIALQTNYNATGYADLSYGSLFAPFVGGETKCSLFGSARDCYTDHHKCAVGALNATDESSQACYSAPAINDCGCEQEYGLHPLKNLCAAACKKDPTTKATQPYWLGPVDLKAYPELTGHGKDITYLSGKVWARVNSDRDGIAFKYAVDKAAPVTPFWEFSGMHLHHGSVDKEHIGGRILAHVAGKHTIKSCLWKEGLAENELVVCSSHCIESSWPSSKTLDGKAGTCFKPANITAECHCGASLGLAKNCAGGCDGDRRGTAGGTAVTASRTCDIGDPERPSNPKQNVWIQSKNSMEYSGNSKDGHNYSPYSVYIPGNYASFCGKRIPSLKDMVLKAGQATYVALHTNYNATGYGDVRYGSLFAPFVAPNEDGRGLPVSKDKEATKCTLFGSERSCYEDHFQCAVGALHSDGSSATPCYVPTPSTDPCAPVVLPDPYAPVNTRLYRGAAETGSLLSGSVPAWLAGVSFLAGVASMASIGLIVQRRTSSGRAANHAYYAQGYASPSSSDADDERAFFA